MAKPIFLIKVSNRIEPDKIKPLYEMVNKRLNNEYNVLVATCLGYGKEAEFECYNAEGMSEIDIEGLKKELKLI